MVGATKILFTARQYSSYPFTHFRKQHKKIFQHLHCWRWASLGRRNSSESNIILSHFRKQHKKIFQHPHCWRWASLGRRNNSESNIILLHTSGGNIKKYFNICIADDGRHSVAETINTGLNVKKIKLIYHIVNRRYNCTHKVLYKKNPENLPKTVLFRVQQALPQICHGFHPRDILNWQSNIICFISKIFFSPTILQYCFIPCGFRSYYAGISQTSAS